MTSDRGIDDVRIVEAFSAANEAEAAAIRAALDAEGIEARVVGDRLGNAWGEVPLGFRSEPKVWVLETDLEAARRVIAELRSAAGTDRASADVERAVAEFGVEGVRGEYVSS